MQYFDTSQHTVEVIQTTASTFEQHQFARLRPCRVSIAQLLEMNAIEKDCGRDGVLEAFTMGGLTPA